LTGPEAFRQILEKRISEMLQAIIGLETMHLGRGRHGTAIPHDMVGAGQVWEFPYTLRTGDHIPMAGDDVVEEVRAASGHDPV